MIALPLPFIIAEVLIFFWGVNEWGFFNTLGLYLLPCLLGMLIVNFVGRMALMNLQTAVGHGKLPGNKILHSGAVFLSGILFLIPSFFTRIIGLVLLLPGLRHIAVWRFKIFMAKQIAKGTSAGGFSFGNGAFQFRTTGMGGFNPNDFRQGPHDFQDVGHEDLHVNEREIHAEVLDVTPLEITHEDKKSKED